MPVLKSGDARIHYALEGQSGSPVLVFSNSLGTNYSMWDLQVREFHKKFRCLRYDTRGHGQSPPTPGPYSIELLGKDVIASWMPLNWAASISGVFPLVEWSGL